MLWRIALQRSFLWCVTERNTTSLLCNSLPGVDAEDRLILIFLRGASSFKKSISHTRRGGYFARCLLRVGKLHLHHANSFFLGVLKWSSYFDGLNWDKTHVKGDLFNRFDFIRVSTRVSRRKGSVPEKYTSWWGGAKFTTFPQPDAEEEDKRSELVRPTKLETQQYSLSKKRATSIRRPTCRRTTDENRRLRLLS